MGMGGNEKAEVVLFMLRKNEWIRKLEDQSVAVRGPICEFVGWFDGYLRARLKDAEEEGERRGWRSWFCLTGFRRWMGLFRG